MSFKRVELGADPEFAIINKETKELIPSGLVLNKAMEVFDLKFNTEKKLHPTNFILKPIERKTRVGNVTEIKCYEFFSSSEKPAYFGSLVEDGVSLELNIASETCRNIFLINVAKLMYVIKFIFEKLEETLPLDIIADPVIFLSEENLAKIPKTARVFGCDPDINIYSNEVSKKIDASRHLKRYFGGHIHSSFGAQNFCRGLPSYTDEILANEETRTQWYLDNLYTITTMFDRIIGIGLTAITSSDLEKERKEIYGQAGKIRLQKWGIEYRTPSNIWMKNSVLTSYALLLTQIANNIVFRKDLITEIEKIAPIKDIIEIINTCDTESAYQVFSQTFFDVLRPNTGLSQENIDVYETYEEYHQSDNLIEFVFEAYKDGIVDKTKHNLIDIWTKFGTLYNSLPTLGSWGEIYYS